MIERIPWSTEAETAMSDVAGAACVPYLRSEVCRGVSKLWRCTSGSRVVHLVTRLDHNPTEFVVCYAEGVGMAEHAPAFIAAARKLGAPIRVHTTKPVVARWLRRFDLRVREYVLRGNAAIPVSSSAGGRDGLR
jgi:hypothetical protein